MNKNYAIFPAKNVRITANYDSTSHYSQSHSTNGVKSYPLDIAYSGLKLIAPCRMKSVKMNGFYNESVLNQVFFQSCDKVLFANGECDYITILAGHTDDWDYKPSQIGTVYERGEEMLDMGTDGNVAAHLDIVIAVGQQCTWVKNSYGEWVLPNSRKWEDVCYIDSHFNTIIDTCGINFKTIPSDAYMYLPSVVSRDTNKDQFQVLYEDVNVRSGAGTNYSVVIYPCVEGIYDVLEINNGWYKIAESEWINIVGGKFLPKDEPQPVDPEPSPSPDPSPDPIPVTPTPIPTEPTEQNGWLVTLLKLILDIIKKIFTKK